MLLLDAVPVVQAPAAAGDVSFLRTTRLVFMASRLYGGHLYGAESALGGSTSMTQS